MSNFQLYTKKLKQQKAYVVSLKTFRLLRCSLQVQIRNNRLNYKIALMTEVNRTCSGRLDLPSIVVLVFLNVVSGVMTVSGNVLVLTAVYRTPSLRIVSNYFIASLSAADLAAGLIINPLLLAKTVRNETTGTSLSLAAEIASLGSITATVYNLCAISLDRFVAITRVFTYKELITKQRCYFMIACIWAVAFLFACSRFMVQSEDDLPKLWIAASVFHFVIPVLIISYCYFHIFKEAKVQNDRIRSQNQTIRLQGVQEVKHRKAAWTVAIVIGVFTLLFSPNIVVASIQNMARDMCEISRLYRYWFWFSWLTFFSSALNPLIYGVRSQEFRNAFKAIFFVGVRQTNVVTPLPPSNMHTPTVSDIAAADIANKSIGVSPSPTNS